MNTLPAPFEERMRKLLAEEANDFFNALQTEPSVSIRLNPVKHLPVDSLFPEEQIAAPVAWCESGYRLKKRPIFTLDPCFHCGTYYVQEASSMFLDHVLKQVLPSHPVKILDLCAAPGGKSTLIAARMPEGSLLVSNEVVRSRTAILKENLIKWGQPNIIITQNDPKDFRALQGAFDFIVVDAPCSGEGMFRKEPQAIREWSENNLQLCRERQRRIVSDIWPCLKVGGFLIYSTCTFNPEENEGIIDFLTKQYDARTIEIDHPFPEIVQSDSDACGHRFYPHRTQGEGFFIGIVQKTDGLENPTEKQTKKNKEKPRPLPNELQQYIRHPDLFLPYWKENTIGLAPAQHETFIRLLGQYLQIAYQGCELAEMIDRKIKLSPALALCQELDHAACDTLEADRTTALTFLKKEEIPAPTKKSDWILITHRGQGLGWCKHLGNRLNNYYPKSWRIRIAVE